MSHARIIFTAALTFTACGGPEEDGLDETTDAVEAADEAELARFPAADEGERSFDATLTAHPSLKPLVSRIELIPDDDCPTRLYDGLSAPLRCLDIRSARHTVISDVDVLSPDTLIRFHPMGAALDAETRDGASLSDCPINKQPNGFADVHLQGIKKFVAAGWHRRDGERRYNVLYRRVGDTYKLLPARPRLDQTLWAAVKPAAGVCVRLGE